MIVKRLQEEMNMVPVVDADTNWPYLTKRKRQKIVKPTSILDELVPGDISTSEELAVEEQSIECYVDEVTRSAVDSVCCYNGDQLCDQSHDYSAMEYEVCCVIPAVDTSQDIIQDTSQDIIQHSSQNIYINHDNSSQDMVEEVIQSEMSEQEMEDSIKELLVRDVSVVRHVVMVIMISCVSFPGKNHYW